MRCWILKIVFQALMLSAGIAFLEQPGFGQVTSQPDFLIKTKVVLVPIDAVVRNGKGELVDKLRADDFEVYDNGVAQHIDLFSRDNKPLNVALIIDNSNSEGKYVSKLRQIALEVLNQLNPREDRVALFGFGSVPLQLTGLTLDRSLVAESIDKIPKLGGTDIGSVLSDATQFLRMQSQECRRAIILVSDNVTMPISGEVLQEMLESSIVLYSIKTPGENPKGLRQDDPMIIAHETGGDVLETNSIDALSGSLNAAVQRLKNTYLIGFHPSAEKNDGSYHKLKINLKPKTECSGCKVQARKGYYAGGHAAPMTNHPIPMFQTTPLRPIEFTPQGLLLNLLHDNNPKQKYSAAYAQLANSIQDDSGATGSISKIWLATVKKTWTDVKNPYVVRYFKFLSGNNDNGDIHFTASAKKISEAGSNNSVNIDLKFDCSQVAFFFSDERYKVWLPVAVALPNVSDISFKFFELSYSEEELKDLLKSKIPLSFPIEIPAGISKASVIAVNPFRSSYGIQSIAIDP
jgi:Ca-activated chloride channel homolog